MSSNEGTFRPKKSVALSGIVAGNTALCSVGKSGNDLHYRGYNILDLAEKAEFEETAYLLIHSSLPTSAQLKAYKTKLKGFRGLPLALKNSLKKLTCRLSSHGRATNRRLCHGYFTTRKG